MRKGDQGASSISMKRRITLGLATILENYSGEAHGFQRARRTGRESRTGNRRVRRYRGRDRPPARSLRGARDRHLRRPGECGRGNRVRHPQGWRDRVHNSTRSARSDVHRGLHGNDPARSRAPRYSREQRRLEYRNSISGARQADDRHLGPDHGNERPSAFSARPRRGRAPESRGRRAYRQHLFDRRYRAR